MTVFGVLCNISFATPIVWRLTRMVSSAYGAMDPHAPNDFGGAAGWMRLKPVDVLGSRVMDFLYWIGIWMSAQTALWVACGFAAVLLNWLALSGIARLAGRVSIKPLTSRRRPQHEVALKAEHTGSVQPCQ